MSADAVPSRLEPGREAEAQACAGSLAFASLAGQVVKPQTPSEQDPPPGFVRVQLCISVRAAFEWLGIYDDKARALIEHCHRQGECDHLVHVDPPRGGIRQVLVRRMRGNHALVFMLADPDAKGGTQEGQGNAR